jgi:hypothetical protein
VYSECILFCNLEQLREAGAADARTAAHGRGRVVQRSRERRQNVRGSVQGCTRLAALPGDASSTARRKHGRAVKQHGANDPRKAYTRVISRPMRVIFQNQRFSIQ